MNWVNKFSINLNASAGETKQQGLINELMRIIQTQLGEGDSLPSVNYLARSLNISRDTVFKAYSELKRRNVVDSAPTKGYYVSKEVNRVLLLLDYYSPFKDLVYQEIKKNLNSSYSIDLVFHHYNRQLFDSVVRDCNGRYNVCIIMNFDVQEFKISDSLKKIDPSKILLLDIPVEDWKDFVPGRYSWIWQDFNTAVFNALMLIRDRIKRYDRFILVNPEQLKHPAVTVKAFTEFCEKEELSSLVITASADIKVSKGDAYFVIRQRDLTTILRQCKESGLTIGDDTGILAFNDTPLYEFVSTGITVMTADFKEMGRKASMFITGREIIREIIPTTVIIRNSL